MQTVTCHCGFQAAGSAVDLLEGHWAIAKCLDDVNHGLIATLRDHDQFRLRCACGFETEAGSVADAVRELSGHQADVTTAVEVPQELLDLRIEQRVADQDHTPDDDARTRDEPE